MNAGVCRGGPLDGRVAESRFPDGLLVVDKERGLAWVYGWCAGEFTCRSPEDGEPLDEDGRLRAAEGPDLDVRAI